MKVSCLKRVAKLKKFIQLYDDPYHNHGILVEFPTKYWNKKEVNMNENSHVKLGKNKYLSL